ncbi:hypothetical protein [Arcticibacter sp. MXS-1]|uniref:hypothetical protein n=1 Tax=Arcticibacter sp. MXS-1 TaxID=3341726 RepID=UPI0035A967D2
MAIKEKNGNINGSIGNEVYRTVKGRTIVQSRPAYVTQTIASRRAASEFALVSTTAGALRKSMSAIYDGYDPEMITRMTAAVRRSFSGCSNKAVLERDLHDGDLSPFLGFQFNNRSPLNKILKVRPSITIDEDGHVDFLLPVIDHRQHLMYRRSLAQFQVTLRLSLFAFNFRKEYYISYPSAAAELRISGESPIHFRLEPLIPDGVTLFACVSLHYYTEDSLSGRKNVNSKEWSPAEIMAARHFREGNTDAESAESLMKDTLPGYKGNSILKECGVLAPSLI